MTSSPTNPAPTDPPAINAANDAGDVTRQNAVDNWGEDIDITDSSQLTTKRVNAFIDWRIHTYKKKRWRDRILFECFQEDFEGWTKETFALAQKDYPRDLRLYLRQNGVFIPKQKGAMIVKTLEQALLDDWHEWTTEEIEKQMNEDDFNSKYNPNYHTENVTTPPAVTPAPTEKYNPNNYTKNAAAKPPAVMPTTTGNPPPNLGLRQTQQAQFPTSYNFSGQVPEPVPVNQREGYEVQYNNGRELSNLMKMYNEDMKYGGEEEDFALQLRIFMDMCTKASVPPLAHSLAFSTMLKGPALEYYYDAVHERVLTFENMKALVQNHFETPERRQNKLKEWNSLTLLTVRQNNPEKNTMETLDILIREMRRIQRGLPQEYKTENTLRDQLLNACRMVPACSFACFKPATTLNALISDLHSSIATTAAQKEQTSQFHAAEEDDQFLVDRKYRGGARFGKQQHGRRGEDREGHSGSSDRTAYSGRYRPGHRPVKKCFVCFKPGCYSTNHSKEEREKSYKAFKSRLQAHDKPSDDRRIQQYVIEFEGIVEQPEIEDNDEIEVMIANLDFGDDHDDENAFTSPITTAGHYLTCFGEVEGVEAVALLNDQAASHALTSSISSTFTVDGRYTSSIFQGILIDTGAARVSTAGHLQLQALKKIQEVELDKSRAGQATIRFGIGLTTSIGCVEVKTPLGLITFHIVPCETPFLLCLRDMDNMKAKFDNLQNLLIQGHKKIPIIRKWGHPFMLIGRLETSLVYNNEISGCHFTDIELRQLHRRFGHPSVRRLARVLERSGHEIDRKALEHLTKYCRLCQLHSRAPGRFKFTLRDDREFNYCVYIDIFYIDSMPVLHVVDEATRFEAARFLQSMSAQHAWDALRACWIDVYLGPPDIVTHDAGKNFASREFRQHASTMAITTKEVPVEAHNSVGRVERYHGPLRRAYEVIRREITGVAKEVLLQMAVKAVNDTAGPDGIVPTLLVFGAYPRMTASDPPSPSIAQRAVALQHAMKEVRQCYAKRQVSDALSMRNGPQPTHLEGFPLNSPILVWREKDKWTGPYNLLHVEGQTCTVALPSGPTNFRSTVVKPFYTNENDDDKARNTNPEEPQTNPQINSLMDLPISARRSGGRPRLNDQHEQFFIAFLSKTSTADEIYMTEKELRNLELSKRLRAQGIITTPGGAFEAARKREIEGLETRGVFEYVLYDAGAMDGVRLFSTRIINEVKGVGTGTPYEKSRLVVQGYNDLGKKEILTQSPTIQRVSQRLILGLGPSLTAQNVNIYLRDITQAYTQSSSRLEREILAKPPKELAPTLPPGTIMRILKPLYGIAEAGTHWFGTYHRHHLERLHMESSTYDPCLLITTKSDVFGIVGMQTDDTLFLGNGAFAALEDAQLTKAKLSAKPVEVLSSGNPLVFNGCRISQEEKDETIYVQPKDQGDRIQTIETNSTICKQEYLEQRARGAYIASICQPEATFDLSVAAQYQDPGENEMKILNNRLKWQKTNKDRGLRYIALNLATAKLFVFVDGSFANNRDFSSQIGYVICLANEEGVDSSNKEFIMRGNLLHWSSVKCKRVTRSVLASELYAMVHGVDIAIALNTTLKLITTQLGTKDIPTIICTDSFSLYECMVKLGTTKEKRLMIDIMALRQSYERRELSEIRWINGSDNPADSMTKSNPSKALQKLIDTNELHIRVEGWVKRKENDDAE